MPASRLYFANSAAPYTPATLRGAWDQSTANISALTVVPTGSGTTAAVAETNAASGWDVLLRRFSYDIPRSGDLSGTVEWIIGVVESAIAADDFWHVHIFVTAGDSDTVRGTLLTDSIGVNEFGSSAAGVGEGTKAVSTVAVTAGDNLVVEVGYQAQNTSTTSRTATMNYGIASGADLTSGSTSVTTLPGWLEFSDPNRVLAPLAPQFRGVGTQVIPTGTSAAPPVPAGVRDGAIVFVDLYLEALKTITPPAGFTLLAPPSPVATAISWHYQFWKRPTGIDTGTYTFTWTGLTFCAAQSDCYLYCVESGSPYETGTGAPTSASRSDSSSAVTPAVSLTTTGDNRLLRWCATNSSGDTWTPPSGWTERYDPNGNTVATLDKPTAGASGSITGTAATASQLTAILTSLLPIEVGKVPPSGRFQRIRPLLVR